MASFCACNIGQIRRTGNKVRRTVDDGAESGGLGAPSTSSASSSSLFFHPGRRFSEVTNEIGMVPYRITKDASGGVRVQINDKQYAPPEISAAILQKMKQAAEDYLGETVTEAVVTVPAYFNDSQRQATKDAGKIAGLDVKRIVNEPTAAALAYGFGKDSKEEQKIAVYDLGGGTFDVTVLEMGDNVFEVRATNGDTHLGGDDFDQQVINWLTEKFKQQYGIDLKQDRMALQRLKEAAETAKKELSSTQSTEINLPFITADQTGPKHLQYTLNRATFEQITADLVERTRRPCIQAMKDAGITAEEIDEVILVGGSTRIPAVQRLVKELFKREPNKGVNPDEVVAAGAAVQGGVLGGDVQNMVLLDVTPLSLGIETLGGVFTKLITRNTTIPKQTKKEFSTANDNQTAVTVHVLQGEREMAAQNRSLGRFDLVGIPPAPRGVPKIEVMFDIDVNGILHVSAKDLATGKEQKIRIESSSGLSDDEIDSMVQDAEDHAEQDKKARESVEAKNEADSLIYATEKALTDYGDKISDEEKHQTEAAVADLRAAMETGNVEDISAKTEALKQASYKLAEEAYKQTQGEGGATGDAGGSPDSPEEPSGPAGGSAGSSDDVEDADYEVVDDEK